MTIHQPIPPTIYPLPASAYIEAEHAVMTDAGLLLITCLSGTIINWHHLAVVDPDTDELLSAAFHALDHGVDADPYRTNATIKGNPYVYDPRTRTGFVVTEHDDPMSWEAAVQVFPSSTVEVRHER